MILSQINLNHLLVFNEVYNTKSMTTAAEKLHLTQSGVSQHIKALEDSLQVSLFDRVNQRIIPTTAANDLYASSKNSFLELEKALWKLRGDKNELSGMVSIGMPVEFGNNLVLPLLTAFGKKHPNVEFQIYLDFANKLNTMLLEGQIDFAFVDDYKMDKRIETEAVYAEQLCLCISETLAPQNQDLDKKYFESLTYVDYQKEETILNMWFEHHFRTRMNLNVRAYIMDVQGIARFITSGFGAGILPLHVVKKLKEDGHKIYIYKPTNQHLENHISLAQIQNRSQSAAVRACIDFLNSKLKETQGLIRSST